MGELLVAGGRFVWYPGSGLGASLPCRIGNGGKGAQAVAAAFLCLSEVKSDQDCKKGLGLGALGN